MRFNIFFYKHKYAIISTIYLHNFHQIINSNLFVHDSIFYQLTIQIKTSLNIF